MALFLVPVLVPAGGIRVNYLQNWSIVHITLKPQESKLTIDIVINNIHLNYVINFDQQMINLEVHIAQTNYCYQQQMVATNSWNVLLDSLTYPLPFNSGGDSRFLAGNHLYELLD